MLATPPNPLLRRVRRTWWSVLKRARPTRPLVIPYDRVLRVQVRPCDRLGKRIYLSGYTEREHATLIDAYLRPGMTYVDVGANFGQFTLMAAQRVGAQGKVHAFEASSVMHAQLAENVRLNGFGNVTVNHAAVSDQPGTLELKVCAPGQEGFNSLGTPMRPDGMHTETVPAVTLDAYVAQHNLTHIDLLKIDVEGAEVHVVRGAHQLLSRGAVAAVACEFNPATLQGMSMSVMDLAQAFRDVGYELYTFDEHRLSIVPVQSVSDEADSDNLLLLKDPKAFVAQLPH